MRKTIYTDEQIELLKTNRYVRECSSKYITFTDDCKIDALRLDEQGCYSQDIFRHFGFPDFFIDSPSPSRTIKHWRHVMRTKGLTQMIGTKKGRKTKEKIDLSSMTKDEYITYLEAKTAYLEELHRRIYGHDP